MYYTFEGIHF